MAVNNLGNHKNDFSSKNGCDVLLYSSERARKLLLCTPTSTLHFLVECNNYARTAFCEPEECESVRLCEMNIRCSQVKVEETYINLLNGVPDVEQKLGYRRQTWDRHQVQERHSRNKCIMRDNHGCAQNTSDSLANGLSKRR